MAVSRNSVDQIRAEAVALAEAKPDVFVVSSNAALTALKQMLASPDQQISLTDPDSRSMATTGRGSGVVGYNVQVAVDTKHHLILNMR
jgi:hypothetical protein